MRRGSSRGTSLLIAAVPLLVFVLFSAAYVGAQLPPLDKVLAGPAATATPTPTESPVASATSGPTPSATSQPSPTARATATPTSVAPAPTTRVAGLPVRLRIPSIGVDAPIVPVGLTATGEMGAPTEAYQVGWYQYGPRPGAAGNALLDGHLDWRRSIAVFWNLRYVQPGDAVVVVDDEGRELVFTVEWAEMVSVYDPPLERVFGATAEPAITLITCGGQFDHGSQNYTHRLVVRAVVAE